MSRPFLEIAGARKQFFVGDTVVNALNGVDLRVERGETLAIVGESGSGKTTLANLILGVEKPTDGALFLSGARLEEARDTTQRRRIGLVQQNPYSTLNPRKSIGQAIGLPLAVHGIGRRAERRRIISEKLERVGLNSDLQDRRPLALSGGQRQRVAIARALTTEPDLLVLDEPTSALDVSVQAHILRLLSDLQKDLGLTYVFITHDLSVVRVLASRVAVMYRGRIVEEGAVEKVFFSPRHRYTQQLLASIPTVSEEEDAVRPGWPWHSDVDSTAIVTDGCPFHPRCPFAQPGCFSGVPDLKGARDHRHACLNPLVAPETFGAA
ncbi:oligopeptide/dipeptide ABC transporter ATP-binding protein [Celeribacter indicus]|uniref:Oligopeptide/dipeptide ABC transporter ATPase n=1 Tax=Celeribacter indicus TaxID=1208324 RepID=A0A0B5E0W6_9RHOB|nr:oligopeptide/dipeptide ABC transporter ATP-binding protein [Celeribacter indicus]AJE47055.1 oligopeptide/dipeptide ABC transporter ATPase [Celeribacter indicus]SDW92017.1 peptide/nickel transport system ATP-binding protein/oligopeptide transport system ATP-binding protein [Celeribacter indicus]